MDYSKVDKAAIQHFQQLIGDAFVFTHQEDLQAYGHDETEDFNFPPEVVLKPATAQEVSDILRFCHTNRIPVTASGARTGLSGAAVFWVAIWP
jgi:glycolate oxidase